MFIHQRPSAPGWVVLWVIVWLGTTGIAVAEATEAGKPKGFSAMTMVEKADAIDRPEIGDRLQIKGSIGLPSGRLELNEGTAVYRLLAGDIPCGLWVDGPATFVHRITDRYSVPLAHHNFEQESKYKLQEIDGGLELREPVKSALIWSFDLSGGSPASGDSASAVGSPGALPKWYGEIFDRTFIAPPSITLLAHRGLGAKGAMEIWMDGKHGYLRLRRDSAIYANEHLLDVEKDTVSTHPVYTNRYYSNRLITTPVGREWWQRFPAAAVAIRHRLDVENTSKRQLKIKAESTIQATTQNVGVYVVDLWTETIQDRRQWPARIQKITVNGRVADYLHRADRLLIALPQPLAAGETAEIAVELEAEWAHRPGGDNAWTLGTGAWYPQPPLNGELAKVEIKVSVPEPFVPFASGEVVERRTDAGVATLLTRVDKPVQFPVVTAGKYDVYSQTEDGFTIHVATYGGGKQKAAKKVAKNFFAAKKYFEDLFDVPYPFNGSTVVEVNEWGFGQAPPGLIFLTKEAFSASQAFDQARWATDQLNSRFIHEVAHAWWGHVAKMDSTEENWVIESFAEYASGLGIQALYGGKKGQKAFDRMLDQWYGISKRASEEGSVYLAGFMRRESWWDRDRTLLLYYRGAAVLHAIRLELRRLLGDDGAGDRAFTSFQRSVLKNFSFQWAHTRHMVTILGQISGTDWQPFFDRYVYGTEVPKLPD